MNLEKILSKLEEEEREVMLRLIEKAQAPAKMWNPEEGDVYYTLTSAGEPKKQTFLRDFFDEKAFEYGNAFKTLQDARFEAECRRFTTLYRAHSEAAGELNNPWDDVSDHYHAYYSPKHDEILITNSKFAKTQDICFPTYESCREAVKILGEDVIKKYILRVES